MKRTATIIWLLLCTNICLKSQTNLIFFYDETMFNNQNTTENLEHKADQEIKFLPGYTFTPRIADVFGNNNQYLRTDITNQHSYINTNNSFNQIYSGLPENNFIDREINTGLPVGAIAGQHNVDLFGAATYTIPISLPPGTNGLMPSLALSYSSLGQSNVLGMGWGVSGISRISKKPQAYYYGLKTLPITESLTYELDGKHFQRNANNYQLVFEENDFQSVYAYNGGFLVQSKDGLSYYYGMTPNSKKDGIFWNVDKIEDNYGNYIEYIYTSDNLIDEIKYTGNSLQSLAPYNKIKFSYKDREDKNTYYYSGESITNNKLIEKIEIFADNQLVKKYRFNYSYSLYSYLYEIIESGVDGIDLNSTIINYKEIGKIENYSHTGIPTQNAEYRTGDFNGDGKSDVLAFIFYWDGAGSKIYSHYNLYLNQGDGVFHLEINEGALPTNFYPFESLGDMSQLSLSNRGIDAIDLNGDGLEDMLLAGFFGDKFRYTPYYSSKDPTTGAISFIIGEFFQTSINASAHQLVLGDFNGDGKVDAFINQNFSSNDSWRLIYFGGYSAPNTTSDPITNYYNLAGTSTTMVKFNSFTSLDYNGDSKSELIASDFNSSNVRILSFEISSSQPKLRELYTSTISPSKNTIKYYGDFNGDGKTDVLSTNGTNFSIYYCTSNGYNLVLFSNISGINFGYSPDVIYIVNDFNGDGKADIYISSKNIGSSSPYRYYTIYYSNGLNFSPQSYLINSTIIGEIFPSIGDFDGNGSSDVLFNYNPTAATPIYFSLTDSKKKLAKDIKNGFNNTVSFKYAPLTNGLGTTVYQKYNTGTNNYTNINNAQFPMHVVYEVNTEDGIGGNNTILYSYEGGLMHRAGKGFLGFSKIISTNNNFKLKTITESELLTGVEYPGAPFSYTLVRGFMPKIQSKLLTSSNTLLSRDTYTNNYMNRRRTVTKIESWDELTASLTVKDFTYDNDGNVETSTVNTNNNYEKSITSNVYAYQGNWMGTWAPKNKLLSTTTTVTRQNQPDYTRSVNFTYNTQGSLASKNEDSGILTTFEHTNGLGNVTKSTVSGTGFATQINSFTYDTKGRFVEETINPLNQHSYATYDARWGVPLTQTGVDGLTSSNQYDGFGRLKTTITPDNITTTSTLAWEIGGGSATNSISADNSLYTSTTTSTGSSTQKTWFDAFSRARKTEIDGFEEKISQVTTYDARGNAATTTTPFYSSEDPVITAITYNDLNLSNTIINTIGTTAFSYVYNTGDHTITTTQTLPDGNSSSSVVDATGKLIKAIDNGGTLDYTYYSSGFQKDIKLNSVLAASMEYDPFGNQTKLTDPNAGVTDYIYNPLGQLTYQKDAKNNSYVMTYDVVGRMLSKTENGTPFGYTYVLSGNGINQLEEITYNNITQHFTYDYLSRVTENKETIDAEDYIFGYQYDNLNRLAFTTYPSSFITKHNYNSFSYPTSVTDEFGNTTFWQAGSMNAKNQYTAYTLGNGQVTNKTYDDYGLPTAITTTNPNIQNLIVNFNPQNGNLMSRENPTKNLLEEFTYDNLHRLKETKVNGVIQLSNNYQGNGNIGFKTDAGDYTYDVNKKNAVVQVSNPIGAISSNLQNITYTPFNSVANITENPPVGGQAHELTFKYGPDQQRRKMEHKVGGTVQKTTYYFGNYEKIKLANGDITELHYIAGGDGLVAIHVITTPNTQPSSPTTYYTYTDHLGSILTLTNQNANIVYEQNFDAWGRERNPNNWDYTNATAMGSVANFSWLTRGYTGHEHLPQLSGVAGVGSLINMNGRFYDPILGRMLSPDNYVQDATNTQNFNKYSYVLNNPLKYTDPSGENWEDFAKSMVNFLTILARLGGANDPDYLLGNEAPREYRKTGGGEVSLGDYSGSGANNSWADREEYAIESYLYGYWWSQARVDGKDFGDARRGEPIYKTRLVKIEKSGHANEGGTLTNPTGLGIRNDAGGQGTYGASRGNRPHYGLDFQSVAGQDIVSPVSGRAMNSSFVNKKGITIPTVVIIPSDPNLGFNKLELLYVGPAQGGWRTVNAGDVIGQSINLQSLGYPSIVGQHIHLQMKLDKTPINPTQYFIFK